MKRKDIPVYLGLAALLAGLAAFPSESVSAAKDGLRMCTDLIVPSLFPFFVLSSMMIELGLAEVLGKLASPVMKRLFNVGGSCAVPFLLGFIGGYPVGARAAITLYDRGGCRRREAERLLCFCNNTGPAFILGVVGAGVFGDTRTGLILYGVHFLSSVTVGLVFRGKTRGDIGEVQTADKLTEHDTLPAVFVSCVKSSFTAVLGICGFVIFFTVLIRLLYLAGIIPAAAEALSFILRPLGVTSAGAEGIISGLIELTSGVSSLRGAAGSMSKNAAMAAFMLGWAGLSVHFQVLGFISESGLRARNYIFGKLLHGVISALYAYAAFSVFSPGEEVALVLADGVTALSGAGAGHTLLISACALVPFAVLSACAAGKIYIERRRLK